MASTNLNTSSSSKRKLEEDLNGKKSKKVKGLSRNRNKIYTDSEDSDDKGLVIDDSQVIQLESDEEGELKDGVMTRKQPNDSQSEPLSFAFNESQLIKPTKPEICIKNFNPDFLIKTWGIATKEESIKSFKDQLQGIGAQVKKEFLDYLGGEKKFQSSGELLKFCKRFPINFSGNFVLAVLIVDYCLTATFEELKLLALTKSLKAKDLALILEQVCMFKIQKHVRSNLKTLDNLETELWNKMNFEFFKLDTPEESNVLTFNESQRLSDMTQTLVNMAFFSNGLLPYESFVVKKMCNIAFWSVNQKPKDASCTMFNKVLQYELKQRENVSVFFRLESEDGSTSEEVYLHDEVVKRFGNGKEDNDAKITGTEQDKTTITSLLYFPQQAVETPITFAVYEMVIQLGIPYGWRFLFQDQSMQEVALKTKIEHLLPIATLERNEDIVRNLTINDITGLKRFSMFKKMTKSELEWLKGVTSLGMKPFDWYKVLVHWAHAQTKTPMTSLKIKYDREADEHFKTVKHLVKIIDLKDNWTTMIQQRYLFREVMQAKKGKQVTEEC